jgi:hypothetical protein
VVEEKVFLQTKPEIRNRNGGENSATAKNEKKEGKSRGNLARPWESDHALKSDEGLSLMAYGHQFIL